MLDQLLADGYDRVMATAERRGLGELRARLLEDVAGHVLVVGAGTGADLAHLPATVDELTLVEPSGPMRAQLATAVPARFGGRAAIVDAFAERLPLPDASVDHAVVSLVLCSVRDVDAAVAELDRVLRPGGTVRLVEHGRSASPLGARAQRVLNPVWRTLAGGCNLDRDTRAAMAARFDVTDITPVTVPMVSRIGRVVAGVAVR